MTPEGLVIRGADEADLGHIVELLRLGTVPGGPPSIEDPGDLGPYRAALGEVAGTRGAVLVAELAGEVVGVCQLIVFRHLQARGGLCAEIESGRVRWAATACSSPRTRHARTLIASTSGSGSHHHTSVSRCPWSDASHPCPLIRNDVIS